MHGSSGSGRSTARERWVSTSDWHTRRSTRSPPRGGRRSWSAARGSGSRRRSRTSSCPPTPRRRRVSGGSGSTTAAVRRRRTVSSSAATLAQRRGSIRTTASGSCGHSSSGRQAARSSRSAPGSGRPRCGCRRSSSASRPRARRSRHGFVPVQRRCSNRASRTRCVSAGEVAPQVLGLDAVRTLPRAEAIAELERATLRFAAYQRKWMRRIPGIVMIDAERPAGEVADAILECADIPRSARTCSSR